MNDDKFMHWIADRLVHVHGENENVDFVLSLRDRADHIKAQKEDAYQRSLHIFDNRVDGYVRDLCERHGYGAVMDSAMRQWINKDEMGAFYIGGCLGYKNGSPRGNE